MSTEQAKQVPAAEAPTEIPTNPASAVKEQVVIFVGGSSGLGFAAIERILTQGRPYKIILGSRSPLAPEQLKTIQPSLASSHSTLKRIECDLARYASVRSFADAIISDHPEEVDVLVLCAGMVGGTRRVTVDGEEETLQVNLLSQALLIDLLLPKLGNVAEKARILFVGSSLHRKVLPGTLTPANINGSLSDEWEPMEAYQITKFLFMFLFFFTDARAVKENRNISTVVVSPGFVPQTGLSRELGFFKNLMMKWVAPQTPFSTSMEEGARLIAKGITDNIPSGTYFDRQGHTSAAEECYDESLRAQWKEWLVARGVWEVGRSAPPTVPLNTFAPPPGPPPSAAKSVGAAQAVQLPAAVPSPTSPSAPTPAQGVAPAPVVTTPPSVETPSAPQAAPSPILTPSNAASPTSVPPSDPAAATSSAEQKA